MPTKDQKNKDQEKSFTALLEELEQCVAMLEKPDVLLEDAITTYERGVSLSSQLTARLESAREKLTVVEDANDEE